MLELKLLEVLNMAHAVSDALVIKEDNTRSVKLIRNGSLIQIEITVMEPLNRSSEKLNNERGISIYMNAINADKVNESLKKIFGIKYEASFMGEGVHQSSPNTAVDCSQIENSEDSRQFAVTTRRGKQSRVAAATLNIGSYALKSPSTTSTTSLLFLKEKLSEYPGCARTGDEEYGGICAKQLLPRVPEESEEDICVLTPRIKPRCNAVFSHKINVRDSVDKTSVSKPSTISLVLATTIDSYEATGPHDTLDGFPEDLELNTLNYMAYRQQNKSESTSDLPSDVIENTPFVRPFLNARENVEVSDINFKKHYEDIETEVIKCVNDLVEQVCTEYEMISQLMNQKEFTNKLLIEAGLSITNQSEHQSTDTQKAKKKTARPIQITFPKTKKKVNKRKRQRRPKTPESEAASKLSIAYETDINLKSPKNDINGPITRRRRKLYSPKDNLRFLGLVDSETGVHETLTLTTSKTPYREIQEMRATHRESTKRISIPEVVLSPRSKCLNDAFDKLLQTDCNDVNIKKSNNKNDISVYNYIDSDDSDFKDDVNLTKPLPKTKASANLIEKKSRKRKQKSINARQDTLIDERMRNATAEQDTSFIIEKPIEICENVEAVIVVEPIIEDENNSTKKSKIIKSRDTKKNTKSKNATKKAKKNAKRPTMKVMNMSRDREESISPGLKCELEKAEKKSNDSLAHLDKINIIEKDEKEELFEDSDCVYEIIETKATIEHVPLVNASIERIRLPRGQTSRGQSSRGQPQDFESIQTIENNNVMPEAANDEICRNKIMDHECMQSFPRVIVERMSEEDINERLSQRAKSSMSGRTSKSSPKPEINHDKQPLVSRKSRLFSPQCEILAKSKDGKICNSLILPFKNNKKSKNQEYERHTPELKRDDPDVDNTEKDICRNSSSIRAVSLRTRKTPKALNNRVLKTPYSKENLNKDIPIEGRAEKLRSISSSESDKRRITRRALKRPVSGNDSSSREEETECSMKECSNEEAIHNWMDRSQHELETEELDGVKLNVFDDIFKEVQKKIDYDIAKIKNNARNSLEHIQRGVVKQIEEARLRRRTLYAESAREIFSDIGKTLDAKFTELESKCERVDAQILKNISRDSTQLLSEVAAIQLDLRSHLNAPRDK